MGWVVGPPKSRRTLETWQKVGGGEAGEVEVGMVEVEEVVEVGSVEGCVEVSLAMVGLALRGARVKGMKGGRLGS
ncbi:hypothetical protein C1H46_039945 [Malus baccata]|uniref:Uncharacterized protein n=1 Tax=Malus baccata TaxID=106549 RepID=A0A540KJX9_MALBA|nr:hypothetical protein C1H46_039945 [Malus baccata]